MATTATTTVAISGGGPAGVMLGLLLARRGVDVVVLEKHGDFLRDFRGDTVHPSTQVVLDQLGLTDEFQTIVRGRMTSVDFDTADGPLLHQELATVRPRFRFHEIALAPQWDLLDLLVRHATTYPSFHIEMEAETVGVIRADRAVRGVRYRQNDVEHELHAVLTVDAEGRHSVLRAELHSELIELGAPIDVLWFRVPRVSGDPCALRGSVGHGGAVIAVNRHDYWQIALVIPKGTADAVRAAGLPDFRARVGGIAPWMADRLGAVVDWATVKLLSVTVDRMRRWSAAGLLAIGDAAHTMSPMGGVGINLAVADAVATANLLGPALLRAQADLARFRRTLNPALVDRVQRRRGAAAIATQRIQTLMQNRVLGMTRLPANRSLRPPAPVRAMLRSPITKLVPQTFVFGLRPESIDLAGMHPDLGAPLASTRLR